MVEGGVLWKAKHRRIKPLILRCAQKTSGECFYAVYVAQAQKLLLRVRFLFTNDNQFGNLLWKEFKTWGKEFAGSYSSKNHQVR